METFDLFPSSKESISSAEVSPAKISASPELAQGSPASARDCGENSPELLATYDRDTSSWRTSQLCLDGDFQPYSETLPRSGMTRNGTLYRRQPSACLTEESGSGLWPTPRTTDANTPSMVRVRSIQAGKSWHAYQLREALLSTRSDSEMKYAPPALYERLMGFPTGWTESPHSATRSSPKSQK